MVKFNKQSEESLSGNEPDSGPRNETNQQDCDVNMSEEELDSVNLTDDPVEDLKNELAELKDVHLRLIADFDNYRKRTLKEKSDLIKAGGEAVFGNILPVIDDFERVIENIDKASDVDALKEGVHLIYEKFMKFLNKSGVKAIESDAVEFDTDLFEAVAIVPAPSTELKGKVIDTIERGYLLNDKVIRHAKVVVGGE